MPIRAICCFSQDQIRLDAIRGCGSDGFQHGKDIVKFFCGDLCSGHPSVVSTAEASDLGHHIVFSNISLWQLLPKVDNEEIGNESPNEWISEVLPILRVG